MKINDIGGIRTSGINTRRKRVSGDDFGEYLAEATPSQSAVAPSGVTDMSALFAVQQAAQWEEREKQINYGNSLLDQLDAYRHALLDGSASLEVAGALLDQGRAVLEGRPDPELAEIIGEIEVRVAVEQAKLESYSNQKSSE